MSLARSWSELLDLPASGATSPPGAARVYPHADGPAVAVAAVYKAVKCDAGNLCVSHVICTAAEDLQRDVIEPGGADLSYHRQNPFVYYEHAQGEYTLPVAKSCGADGKYSVRQVGDRLLADTYFAPTKMGEDLFKLYEADLINGWSIGMLPTGKNYTSRGPVSKSLGRPPLHFRTWKLLEYSATPTPINPEAATILVEKGRVGATYLSPVILKSLTAHTLKDRKAVVAVPPHPLTMKNMATDATPDAEVTPTAKLAFDTVQGVLDLCAAVEAGIKKSEHVKAKAAINKSVADLKAVAAEMQAIGDGVVAGADDLDVDEPAPVEIDEAGGVLLKSGYRPSRYVRWTTADVQKAEAAAKETAAEPEADPALAEQVERFNRLKKLVPSLGAA